MDITYYFSDKKIDEIQIDYTLLKKGMADGLTNEKIDILEYSYMTKFIKNKGNIVNMKWMLELLNKLDDKKILDESTKLFNILEIDTSGKLNINTGKIINGLIETGQIKEYSDDQKKAINNMINFLSNHNETVFGLYGYAGTGKTTTIVELTSYFIKKGLIKSIAYTAPTNKAVSVIKSKFRHHIQDILENVTHNVANYDGENIDDMLERLYKFGINIDFITIHRLLGYKNDFDNEGERIFCQKGDTNIKDYQMILIDECSMLPQQMIVQLFSSIRDAKKLAGNNFKNIPKIIFTGDRAQLNAVNEISNILFNQTNVITKNDHILNMAITDIKKMESIVMKQVMRSKIDNIINLCINTRQWLEGDIKFPEPRKYVGNGVHIYKKVDSIKKTDSKWFKTYLENFKNNANTLLTSNIILTWTNKQCDEYNNVVRKRMFSNKKVIDKFEIGDILMLSDFYILDELKSGSDKDNRFYTSEQIKIVQIERTPRQSIKFSENLPRSINKLKNHSVLESRYKTLVKNINGGTKRNYNIWKLHVNKLNDVISDSNNEAVYIIMVIDDSSEKLLNDEKQYCATAIKKFRSAMVSEFKTQAKTVDKIIIRQLWREWNKIFIEPFARVNYGCSITTHKSQSSTYATVFIDVDDILRNNAQNEAKRCLYTALTRASKEIHLLV